MNREILKFHYEEIVYVLMILTTNLKAYAEEDLKSFAEAIHRLDTLSEPDFLKELKLINPIIDDVVISNIVDLQSTISQLYAGQWYKALAKDNNELNRSYILSKQLLKELHQEYIEPIKYAEKNMDVNW